MKHFFRAAHLILLVSTSLELIANGLDDYLAQEDLQFIYKEVGVFEQQSAEVYLLKMTSQQWKTSQEVENPLWEHWVKILIPPKVQSSTILLFIRGGSSSDLPPENTSQELLEEAIAAETIVAEVYNVPNQPIKFVEEKDPRFLDQGRKEDAIVATTWKKYFETKDTSWPLRVPMTKAVVKAMDTVSAFLQKEKGLVLEKYVLTGESKRGWAAWTSAAVDKRVVALVPVACDFLNTKALVTHQYRSYGAWPISIQEYIKSGLADFLLHKAFEDLLEIEDPFSYRDHLNIPKYLINATGDKFGVVDAMQFYLPHLLGDNYVRFIPNTDHYLHKFGYLPSVFEFFKAIAYQKPLPHLEWKREGEKLGLTLSRQPYALNLWTAHNPKARDFRAEEGITWEKEVLAVGTQTLNLVQPDTGWKAYFVEAIFKEEEGREFPLTTEIFVLPDHLPYSLGR